MNYYFISYDINGSQGGVNPAAWESLMSLIREQLSGEVLKHPVESTAIFSSSFDFNFVRQEIYNWSQAQHTYYSVAKIAEDVGGDLLCRLVSNPDLESALDESR